MAGTKQCINCEYITPIFLSGSHFRAYCARPEYAKYELKHSSSTLDPLNKHQCSQHKSKGDINMFLQDFNGRAQWTYGIDPMGI